MPLAVTVGGRVLYFGGSDSDPCPPNASCVRPSRPLLRDGAAYDVASDTWTRLAPAPGPVAEGSTSTAVIGSRVYLLTTSDAASSHQFLAYDVSKDEWASLPSPQGRYLMLAALGDHIAAFAQTHEQGGSSIRAADPVPSDFVYDAAAGRCSALPADPHRPSFDRQPVAVGEAVVLLTRDLVPNPGTTAPITRTAILEVTADGYAWRRAPDGQTLSTYGFRDLGGVLVNIGEDSADGGEVNNWGRRLHETWAFDVATATWSELPARRRYKADPPASGAAVSGARHMVLGNWLYDASDRTWTRLPRRPAAVGDARRDESRTTAWVDTPTGGALLIWGGVRWAGAHPGAQAAELLSDGWRLVVAG